MTQLVLLTTPVTQQVPDPRFPFLGVHFTPRMDGRSEVLSDKYELNLICLSVYGSDLMLFYLSNVKAIGKVTSICLMFGRLLNILDSESWV